uniref:Uncharacterized protein n=1 Tax=Colobus angolensis palliatus TaxID=336983 RepID=A0A2K5JHV8_COLAP
MAASAEKKNKKDGGTGGGSTYVSKPVSWADETDDLEGEFQQLGTGQSPLTQLLEKEK